MQEIFHIVLIFTFIERNNHNSRKVVSKRILNRFRCKIHNLVVHTPYFPGFFCQPELPCQLCIRNVVLHFLFSHALSCKVISMNYDRKTETFHILHNKSCLWDCVNSIQDVFRNTDPRNCLIFSRTPLTRHPGSKFVHNIKGDMDSINFWHIVLLILSFPETRLPKQLALQVLLLSCSFLMYSLHRC